jgi:hypothetical protein
MGGGISAKLRGMNSISAFGKVWAGFFLGHALGTVVPGCLGVLEAGQNGHSLPVIEPYCGNYLAKYRY